MSQEWHYTQATTPGNAGFDTIITAVRLGEVGLVAECELMQAGQCGVWVDDAAGALDFMGQSGWRLNETACPAGATLTGTVAKAAGSTTITGTGTSFTTQLTVGREIAIPGTTTEYFIVSAIASDTSLTVFNAAVNTASGQTATVGGMKRVWTGYVGDQDTERGLGRRLGGEPFSAGRDWNLQLEDLNVFLHDRIINATNWPTSFDTFGPKRPAETVGTRLKWLLAGGVWSDTVWDEGLVDYPTNPMDKADLTGRFGDEVLNEMCQMTGHNAGLYYHEITGHYALFFNDAASGVGQVPMRLTNGGDEDFATTWPVWPDSKLTRSPRRRISGVQVTGSFPGSPIYRELATTSYTGRWRDGSAPNANLKTLAVAQAYGDRYLADLSSQDLRLAVTYTVPAAHVNDVREFQKLQVKLTNQPGLGSYAWCRVLRRQIKDAVAANGDPVPGMYEVSLDLSFRPCAPACPCSMSSLAFGDSRPNRLHGGYPSTTDSLEAFADIQNHIPAPWLTTDTWSDSPGGSARGPNPYLAGTCVTPPISTSDGNPEAGMAANPTHVTIVCPAVATTYHVVYGGSTAFDFTAPAFATPPSANIIEIGQAEAHWPATSLTLVVDGVTICTGLAATFYDQARTNPCATGTDTITPRVARFTLPSIAQGRTWAFSIGLTGGSTGRIISVAGYLDPDDGTCAAYAP
ncbi:MAG TPA: hypothetical protein VNF73_17420 [Candidatus Saccharimonadales bacterium]|nr:hypothetical protein [Candidatus Saccharimonadales bacterium]